MSADTGPSAINMSQSSSNTEQPPGFDLPPMPVPYEDFHFSLDLPDNIEPSDLSLLEKGDFDTLFGTSSVTGTPNIMASSALFGSATPAVHTPAGTSTHPVGGPLAAAAAQATTIDVNDGTEPQSSDSIMTSMPSETTPTASNDPSQGRPPPPPPTHFQPPPQPDGSSGMFSFDSLFGGSHSTPAGSSQLQHTGMPGAIAIPSNASAAAVPLFDTNESDFLSNFLEGFESSWDFNPALPDNMPSYAAAAAAAQARLPGSSRSTGEATPSSSSGHTVTTPNNGGRTKRAGRGNSAASSHPTPPDLQQQQQQQQQQQHFFNQHYNGYSHPPHAHMLHNGGGEGPPPPYGNSSSSTSSMPAAAVFGGHLAMGDEPDGGLGTGSKRSFGNSRVGEEKRRGSLAQVGTGFYTHQPAVSHAPPWLPGTGPPPPQQGHFGNGAQPHHYAAPHHQQQHHNQHHYKAPLTAAAAFGGPFQAHGYMSQQQQQAPPHPSRRDSPPTLQEDSGSNSNSTPKRELLTEKEKRQNHILSEQRRRNHIREGFTELVSLLDLGRLYGARGLGLSSGAGTGIEDEGLDDRTDVSSDEDSDEEAAALAKTRRKKARAKKNALLNAAAAAAAAGATRANGGNGALATGASRGRGKGRGRGGSAGGGAGSKSAVLFQAVDLIKWLEVRNAKLEEECSGLEEESGMGSEPVAAL